MSYMNPVNHNLLLRCRQTLVKHKEKTSDQICTWESGKEKEDKYKKKNSSLDQMKVKINLYKVSK